MTVTISRKQVLANVAALLSGTALSRGLSALILILVARQIGRDAYGQYSATIALVGLVAILFSLGLEGWLLYKGGSDREHLGVWFTSAFWLTVLLGIGWMAGLWFVTPYLNPSSFPWSLIVLASLALWLEEVARLIWSAFKARMRNNLTSLLMVVSQGAFLVVCLLLAAVRSRDAEAYMAGRLVAAALGAVASGLLLRRELGIGFRPRTLRPALRGTLPFAASTGFSVIYGRADLAIVGHMLGKTAAGVYAPALTLTNTLFLIPVAVYEVMVPLLGRGYKQDRAWTARTAAWFAVSMLLVGIALAAGLAWISRPLITILYGTDFQSSAEVLAVLAGVLALRCPTIALSALLVAVGWQSPRVGVQALSAVLNVALNLLVVRGFGVMGVARVYLGTELVLLLGHLGLYLLWIRSQRA